MAGLDGQVKVSLAFQTRSDADIVRRKKVLTFKAKDSIHHVYATIAGRLGGAPLWPKDFGERLEQGEDVAAQLFFAAGDSSTSASPNWQAASSAAVVGELVSGTGQGAFADLLLRIVENAGTEEQEPKDQAKDTEALASKSAMYYSRTFLHFKEEEDSSREPSPRAHSDPISQCPTPCSRASSKEPAKTLGLVEQAEVERKTRRTVEDYIQTRLLPLAGSRTTDNASSQRGRPRTSRSPGLRSPLRILEPKELTTELSPTKKEEPAYLPSGPPGQLRAGAAGGVPPPVMVPPLGLPINRVTHGPTISNYQEPPKDLSRLLRVESPRELWEGSEPGDGILLHPNAETLKGTVPSQPMMAIGSYGLNAAEAFQDDMDGMMLDHQNTNIPGQMSQGAESPLTAAAEELFEAVSNNDLASVRRMLESRTADVNTCTARGSHILFRAVIKARDVDIVLLLLSVGADARATDEKGNQVLHFWARATAAKNQLFDIGRALLLAGADPNAQRSSDGMSPLHHVVVGHNSRRGWLDFHKALLLVRHGANIHLLTTLGQSPLSLVANDTRAATKQLVQLLQFGIYQGQWPTCGQPGCPWCM